MAATSEHEFSAPIAPTDAAHLELVRPPSGLALGPHGDDGELYRARFGGDAPMVFAHDGKVTVEYPRLDPSSWLRRRVRKAEILLSPAVPWTLVVQGGSAKTRADLRRLAIVTLELAGGATDVELLLGPPRGRVSIRVDGGASRLAVLRPRGTATTLRIVGGATDLAFDGERYGAIGGETRLEANRASEAADRYEIEIAGGASTVTIGELDTEPVA